MPSGIYCLCYWGTFGSPLTFVFSCTRKEGFSGLGTKVSYGFYWGVRYLAIWDLEALSLSYFNGDFM